MGFLKAAANDLAAFIPTLRQPGIPSCTVNLSRKYGEVTDLDLL
jgi:hypothetical protein